MTLPPWDLTNTQLEYKPGDTCYKGDMHCVLWEQRKCGDLFCQGYRIPELRKCDDTQAAFLSTQ